MSTAPQIVIHINFLPEELLFEPRRIWTALNEAERRGTIDSATKERLLFDLGGTAIHLATRDYMVRAAVKSLQQHFQTLGNLIDGRWIERDSIRVIGSKEISVERDFLLLAVDSFLFEFRAYLELLAKFVHELYCRTGQAPPQVVTLSTGKRICVHKKNGELQTHGFLLFLCDRLSLPSEWYEFLVKHRNFFTHEASPYIAIEDRLVIPPEYDLIVMRTNIREFKTAAPADYFRLSECARVVEGLKKLTKLIQEELTKKLEG